MGETIKGMVAAGGKLYVRGEQRPLHVQGQRQRAETSGTRRTFPAAPADRPFADFFFDEIHDLVNGSTIVNEDRQELCDAIMVMVTEGFLPAYEDLRAIRAYKDDPRIPVLNRKKHYDDFARASVAWIQGPDAQGRESTRLRHRLPVPARRELQDRTRGVRRQRTRATFCSTLRSSCPDSATGGSMS